MNQYQALRSFMGVIDVNVVKNEIPYSGLSMREKNRKLWLVGWLLWGMEKRIKRRLGVEEGRFTHN